MRIREPREIIEDLDLLIVWNTRAEKKPYRQP